MAPEQLLGAAATPASDVYALGVLCYEVLTGVQPFPVLAPMVLALWKLRHLPHCRAELVPALSRRWDKAVLRCLSANPQKRSGAPPTW